MNPRLYYCRLDKELTIHERANDIRTRWTPNDENYKSEVDLKNLRRCTEVYDKIKTVCEERLFLLKLKEKYSGKCETPICIYIYADGITLLHLGVVEHSVRRASGCSFAILQSPRPLWSFEHSGPMTLCPCVDALVSPCCTACVW